MGKKKREREGKGERQVREREYSLRLWNKMCGHSSASNSCYNPNLPLLSIQIK